MNTYTFVFSGQVEIEAETEAEAYETADDLLGVSAWQGDAGVSVDDIRLVDTEEDEEETYTQPIKSEPNNYDDWTCIYDDLPKDNHTVLACDTEGNIEKAFYFPNAEKWLDMNGDKWKNVIAWMELPKAYKGGKQ